MSLDNYFLLFTGQHEYWTWFTNSIILTVVSTLLVSAFVGYGFAAYEFKGLPRSLLEAGRIDGATEYGIFFRLIIPIFILFICFQQYFIEGMTAGAVKE